MASHLVSIPTEMKVSIFGSCDDVDDALHLSQVCQNLRSVFQIDRRRIERSIITSSRVYDYDFCLSNLLTVQEVLFRNYPTLGKRLPDRFKPSIRVFESCLRTKDEKEASTDQEIQKIIARWKSFSFLRGLYVDDNVSREFERFRAAFTSSLTPEQGASILSPGLSDAIIESSHVNGVRVMPKNRFVGDFKARFHKILCLHSMAIISLQLAKISRVEPEPTTSKPKQEHAVTEIIENLWTKEFVLAGGKTTAFQLDTQLDGLEVFDFLYLFLLRKILPYQRLVDWIGNDAGDHPFEWNVAGVPNALELPEWYSFMRNCCKVLQPDDLVGLIENRTWAAYYNYPPNKSMYMRVRGMFERGNENELRFNWDTDFERVTLVRALYTTSVYNTMVAEEPCWWDHVRLRLGSPFLKNSIYAYENKIDDISQESVTDADIMRVAMED